MHAVEGAKVPTSWGRARRKGYLWLRLNQERQIVRLFSGGHLPPIRRPGRRISPADSQIVWYLSFGTFLFFLHSLGYLANCLSNITLHSTPLCPRFLETELGSKKLLAQLDLSSEKEAKSPITTTHQSSQLPGNEATTPPWSGSPTEFRVNEPIRDPNQHGRLPPQTREEARQVQQSAARRGSEYV